MEEEERQEKIARLNDEFRRTGAGGQVFQTAGIAAMPESDQRAIHTKVRLFATFNEANDPYGEHDFGAFKHNGEDIFWKIDYYAPDMEYGSEDPADPDQTVRVMTIMLAHER